MKKTVILFIGIFFLSFSCFAQSENKNINDQSAEAEEINTLETPANFQATALDDQSVTLTWDDICEIEEGFIIERKDSSESFSEIASLNVNSTSFTDKGLTFDVKYTYRICSYNHLEKSDYSEKVSVKTIFPQPLDLAVEIINDQSVKLTWVENCAFEDGFIVERKEKGTEFQEIERTEKDKIEFTDKGLLYRNKYTYRICGFTALNKSDYSGKIVVETIFPIPANIKVRALDDQSVRLSWEDRCDFEKGFIIERKVKKEEFSNIAELTENTTYYDDKGLTDGNVYYYRIKAFSQLNESDYSSEIFVSTSFPAPQNLYVDVLNDHSCKLYWEDKSSFVTGFIVERKENEGEFEQIAELGGITKNYVDETMVLGSYYIYRITALSKKNSSSYSNEISTKTDFPGPANLYSETIDDQSLRLYWEDNSVFEEGFKLERKDEDSDYIEIALLEPNTTTFIDKNLKYGITYIYRVAAYTITSTTGYSNEHSAKTIFPKPSYLSAQVLDDQSIKLSWLDNCTFDKGFKLERKENGGEFHSIVSLDAETTSYLDENLHFGTNYIYRVFAVTKLNNSDYSNIVEVKTFFPEPTYLSSEVIDDQTISLYWEDNCSFEAGFRLERKMDSKEFSEIAVFSENTTSFKDKDLSFGKTY
ncbi:MAG: fibronectin type III domain-containing protein, partial [Candidatus Cloacimonetes bacterium]|nr:fibronectin type III domain-containing protein [Candidatus Cloacimonadota bacterium]